MSYAEQIEYVGVCSSRLLAIYCLLILEQKIDGRALIMLATKGSLQQLEACGLLSVGEQLHLKGMVESKLMNALPVAKPAEFRSGKPTKRKLSSLDEMQKQVYKVK